jgi:exodeoxyribonuclease-3
MIPQLRRSLRFARDDKVNFLPMKIVSFNINGIRARPHQLEELVRLHEPDVIGLQETKVADEMFPLDIPAGLGYEVLYHGQKGHYGVALFSRVGLANPQSGYPHDGEEAQKRLVGIDVPYNGGTLTIYNGYFPQGESRDHPVKFPYKQKFYADLMTHLREHHQPDDRVIIMGDFNIAPTDLDIGIGEKNMKRWLQTGKCSFLPEEREWMASLKGWGLTDVYRELYPEATKMSWFDYRSRGFDDNPKRGLRIDYHLLSAPLLDKVQDIVIDHDIRAMERPSDHCPVVLTLG